MLISLLRRQSNLNSFRSSYFSLLLRRSSSKSSTAFFHENPISRTDAITNNDFNPNLKFKHYYDSQNCFINPCSHYNKHTVARPKKIEQFYTPPQNFQDIIDQNENNIPVEGSFVEITRPDFKPRIGLVVRQALSRFDERYNKLQVLTSDNELIDVSASEVNFHLHQMIPHDFINCQQIVTSRHNKKCKERIRAIEFLDSFINDVVDLKTSMEPMFDRIYAQVSTNSISHVTLVDIIDAIKYQETLVIKIGSSFYNQCVLLFSIHWCLVSSPKWIVPNYFANNKLTNVLQGHSNNFHTRASYFVTPGNISVSISKFMRYMKNPDSHEIIEKFLAQLKTRNGDELSHFLQVYDGRHLAYILEVIKFAIVYPHDSIIKQLNKLASFKNCSTPNDLYNKLLDLNIYDKSTDVVLSSGIVGSSDRINVSSADQLQIENLWSGENGDLFRHLRTKKKYYRDHIIYGLPLDDNETCSRFAISLETINSRKYILNIHIPDITTVLPPGDFMMENMFDKFTELSNKFSNSFQSNLFSNRFEESKRFHKYETVDSENLWDDELLQNSKSQRNPSKVTCMTISFQFNSYEPEPFKYFENKISVSFDSISNLNVKILDKELLEKCLSGKLETSLFKLLRRNQTQGFSDRPHLNKGDIHNINYINGIMKTFFKMREHSGAAVIKPQQESLVSSSSNFLSKIGADKPRLYSHSDFILRELQIFTGALVAEYCTQHRIPAMFHCQDVEPTVYDSDKVMVTHDNIMIPPYDSENYHHSILAKDSDGYISLQASFVSKNYLSPENVIAGPGNNNLLLGLKNGYINIVDVFTKKEAIINQYQLLSYQQALFSRNLSMEKGYLKTVQQFNILKSLGYQLQGPLTESRLGSYIEACHQSHEISSFVGSILRKYVVLKWLEKAQIDINEGNGLEVFHCIVTLVGKKYDLGVVCKCFCMELGIEIDVLTENSDIHIGSKLVCDKVLQVNAIDRTCLLRDENYGSTWYL
ncbi:hypothetical protein MEO_05485 [Candida albicans P94015]|nr:hypothetical protein MEO_05485 [Candida albicans P94015]